MSAAVAGTTSAKTPFRPTPSYTTLRDVTHNRELDIKDDTLYRLKVDCSGARPPMPACRRRLTSVGDGKKNSIPVVMTQRERSRTSIDDRGGETRRRHKVSAENRR